MKNYFVTMVDQCSDISLSSVQFRNEKAPRPATFTLIKVSAKNEEDATVKALSVWTKDNEDGICLHYEEDIVCYVVPEDNIIGHTIDIS